MYTQVYPLQLSQTMSMNDSYILILDAPESGKQVPVLIGAAEAQSLILAIEQQEVRRPLTHNLICNIMEEYLLTLKRVTIDRFEEGIFYSTLHVSDGFSEKQIDSRTSDAIVLAMLQHCDIDIDLNVLEETSMLPGALEGNLPDPNVHPIIDESLEDLEKRLRQCEADEDYEQAAEIQKQIERLKNI